MRMEAILNIEYWIFWAYLGSKGYYGNMQGFRLIWGLFVPYFEYICIPGKETQPKRGALWPEPRFQSGESETETMWDMEVWSSLGLPSLGRSSKQADVTLKGATTSYVGATIPYSCVGSPRDRVGWCWQAGDSKFLPLKMLSASLNSSPSLHINNKGKGIMRRSGDGSLWSHFSSLFRQLHRKRSLVSIIKTQHLLTFIGPKSDHCLALSVTQSPAFVEFCSNRLMLWDGFLALCQKNHV